MVQHRLQKYFRSQQDRGRGAVPKTTFLLLPYNIRRRIYLHAGLLSNSTNYLKYVRSSNEHCIQAYNPHHPESWPSEEEITPRSHSLSHFIDGYLPWPATHLNRHCTCLDIWYSHTWYNGCKCDPLPWQLLYVSKTIAEEVSSIFYSENHFGVFRDSLGGLSGLRSLPKDALTKLTSLSICLNFFDEEGRGFGPESRNWCHAVCSTSTKERLFRKAKRHDELASIKEWQQIFQLLKSHIKPNQLKLYFLCDVAHIEIAEEVLRPFWQLPPLRECSIRLGLIYLHSGSDQSGTFLQLAKQTVNMVISRSSQRNFRYTELPTEIQLQILGYTDLVTPYDLVWCINTEIGSAISSPFYEKRTFHCHADAGGSSCCGQCSPISGLCSCWTRRAAFSTTCTCWRFPISFVLVNRKMKEHAEFVFYSKNHFSLLPRGWNKNKELEIWNFLTWIPGYQCSQ